VVLGTASTRQVGCVEGLLLLGEWNLINHGEMCDGAGEAAWSILGLAVILAYRLRLQDSFRSDGTQLENGAERNRLAWTCNSPPGTIHHCFLCQSNLNNTD